MSKQFIYICLTDEGKYVQPTRRRWTDTEKVLERMEGVAKSRLPVMVEVPSVEIDEAGYPVGNVFFNKST